MANIDGTIIANKIIVRNDSDAVLLSAGDNEVQIAGWKVDSNSLYSGDSFSSADCFICTGSNGKFSIGGSGDISGWMLKAGSGFGVTNAGAVYANNGSIGGWNVSSSGLSRVDTSGQIHLLPSAGLSDEYTVGGLSTTDWVILAGPDNSKKCTFGLTRAGRLHATEAYLSGEIHASGGSIAGWTIDNYTIDDGSVEYYSGDALMSEQSGSTSTKVALTPKGVYYSYYDGTKQTTAYASWGSIVRTTSAAAASMVSENDV